MIHLHYVHCLLVFLLSNWSRACSRRKVVKQISLKLTSFMHLKMLLPHCSNPDCIVITFWSHLLILKLYRFNHTFTPHLHPTPIKADKTKFLQRKYWFITIIGSSGTYHHHHHPVPRFRVWRVRARLGSSRRVEEDYLWWLFLWLQRPMLERHTFPHASQGNAGCPVGSAARIFLWSLALSRTIMRFSSKRRRPRDTVCLHAFRSVTRESSSSGLISQALRFAFRVSLKRFIWPPRLRFPWESSA